MEKDRFESFTNMLSDAMKSITKIKSRGMSNYGLGSTHTECIRRLYSNPEGLTRKTLSELCHIDKALISRVISELTQKGYVSEASEKKGYRKKIRLTEDGIRIAKEINNTVKDLLKFVSGEIPESKISEFYSTLATICEKLKTAEQMV